MHVMALCDTVGAKKLTGQPGALSRYENMSAAGTPDRFASDDME